MTQTDVTSDTNGDVITDTNGDVTTDTNIYVTTDTMVMPLVTATEMSQPALKIIHKMSVIR